MLGCMLSNLTGRLHVGRGQHGCMHEHPSMYTKHRSSLIATTAIVLLPMLRIQCLGPDFYVKAIEGLGTGRQELAANNNKLARAIPG